MALFGRISAIVRNKLIMTIATNTHHPKWKAETRWFSEAGEPTMATDLPPLKWSSLKYDFRTEDKINGKEEAYG